MHVCSMKKKNQEIYYRPIFNNNVVYYTTNKKLLGIYLFLLLANVRVNNGECEDAVVVFLH